MLPPESSRSCRRVVLGSPGEPRDHKKKRCVRSSFFQASFSRTFIPKCFQMGATKHMICCLQHVGCFAETSKNVCFFCFCFLYRFLTTFCRSPELPKKNQNASKNEVSSYQNLKNQEHMALKKTSKTQRSKSQIFGCKMT